MGENSWRLFKSVAQARLIILAYLRALDFRISSEGSIVKTSMDGMTWSKQPAVSNPQCLICRTCDREYGEQKWVYK